MSPNRRTSLDIPATYGRVLNALGCGRRAVMALGEVDCGLMGVEFVHGVPMVFKEMNVAASGLAMGPFWVC